jgi:hypothetical protein
MVFSAECRKGLPAVKTIFRILVAHPEIFAEQFASELRKDTIPACYWLTGVA